MSASAVPIEERLSAHGVRVTRRPRRRPESLAEAVAPLDRRTRVGRDVAAFREQLTRHIGKPSPAQSAMINLAVQLRVRLASMDRDFAERGEMSAHASRTYLAWANSLSRVLAKLGLQGTPEPEEDLATYLRRTAEAA